MRRWLCRGMLAVMAVLVLLGSATTVKAFNLACNGSLEGFRYLTNVRREIRAATALPPTPTPVPTPPPPTVFDHAREAAGRAGAAAIVAILWVKQSDVVAYPAHIAAAHVRANHRDPRALRGTVGTHPRRPRVDRGGRRPCHDRSLARQGPHQAEQ